MADKICHHQLIAEYRFLTVSWTFYSSDSRLSQVFPISRLKDCTGNSFVAKWQRWQTPSLKSTYSPSLSTSGHTFSSVSRTNAKYLPTSVDLYNGRR